MRLSNGISHTTGKCWTHKTQSFFIVIIIIIGGVWIRIGRGRLFPHQGIAARTGVKLSRSEFVSFLYFLFVDVLGRARCKHDSLYNPLSVVVGVHATDASRRVEMLASDKKEEKEADGPDRRSFEGSYLEPSLYRQPLSKPRSKCRRLSWIIAAGQRK